MYEGHDSIHDHANEAEVDALGVMGDTGRSETRHLRFKLSDTTDTIDPCAGSWSFDHVYDPCLLGI